jgi:hypothetical protein
MFQPESVQDPTHNVVVIARRFDRLAHQTAHYHFDVHFSRTSSYRATDPQAERL